MTKLLTVKIINYKVIDIAVNKTLDFEDAIDAEEYYDALKIRHPNHQIIFVAVIGDSHA